MLKNMRMTPPQRAWQLTGLLVVIGGLMGVMGGAYIGMFVAPVQAIILYPHGASMGSAFWGTVVLSGMIGAMYLLYYVRKRILPL